MYANVFRLMSEVGCHWFLSTRFVFSYNVSNGGWVSLLDCSASCYVEAFYTFLYELFLKLTKHNECCYIVVVEGRTLSYS